MTNGDRFSKGAKVKGRSAAEVERELPKPTEPTNLKRDAWSLARANLRKPWARRWLRQNYMGRFL